MSIESGIEEKKGNSSGAQHSLDVTDCSGTKPSLQALDHGEKVTMIEACVFRASLKFTEFLPLTKTKQNLALHLIFPIRFPKQVPRTL